MGRRRLFKGINGWFLLLLVLMLSACGPNETGPAVKDGAAGKVGSSTEDEAAGSEAALPEYVPSDFPLPDDVKIVMQNSSVEDGKKYAMFVIQTEESMDSVVSMYRTYFEKRELEDAGQTFDDKNIIVQGESQTNAEYWSMIGGQLTDSDVIELTISWEEL